MSKRFLWAALVGALAVTAIAGSSTAMTGKTDGSNAAQVLKMSIGSEPPSLDPGLATDTTSSNIILNIMDPLVKLGKPPALNAVPAAAASWKIRGATVTLNLRKSVRWTNGQPVVAQDYVYGWLRTISPELGADYAYQFEGIKGAKEYTACDPKKANCNALRANVGVKAVGKYTLRVTLVSPQPWFIQQISHHSFLPQHKATIDRYGSKWTEPQNIVTNGPFKLASWRHDASITLVKNTKWRNAKSVKLNRVEHQIIVDATTAENAFSAKNIDLQTTGVASVNIPKWKRTPYWKVFKALGTYYYGFNTKNIPDVNQRRAMAISIDRSQIVKYITKSGQIPAKGFTPSGIAGGPTILSKSTMPATAQLTKAKAALAKARNPKRSIRLYHNNAPNHVKIATAVQNFWRQLGLDVTIRPMEWKQYLQFLGPPPNADVDVYRLGWIYDFPDAYNGLVLWKCDSGNNNTNWCNRKFDSLVDRATRTPNTAKRLALYQQAENILTGPQGQLPIMPIYFYTFHVLQRENVKGFIENPTGQWDLAKVSIR